VLAIGPSQENDLTSEKLKDSYGKKEKDINSEYGWTELEWNINYHV